MSEIASRSGWDSDHPTKNEIPTTANKRITTNAMTPARIRLAVLLRLLAEDGNNRVPARFDTVVPPGGYGRSGPRRRVMCVSPNPLYRLLPSQKILIFFISTSFSPYFFQFSRMILTTFQQNQLSYIFRQFLRWNLSEKCNNITIDGAIQRFGSGER